MGTNFQYMGAIGTGQAMKLVNNHLVALSMVSLIECVFAGERLGLERTRILDVLGTVPVTSAYHRMKLPMLANREYPPMFSGDNMLKDIRLALESEGSRESLPLLDISEKLYSKLHDLGYGGEDLASIDRLYS